MKEKCSICKRKLCKNKSFIWIIQDDAYRDLNVCEECGLSLEFQIFKLMKERLAKTRK